MAMIFKAPLNRWGTPITSNPRIEEKGYSDIVINTIKFKVINESVKKPTSMMRPPSLSFLPKICCRSRGCIPKATSNLGGI